MQNCPLRRKAQNILLWCLVLDVLLCIFDCETIIGKCFTNRFYGKKGHRELFLPFKKVMLDAYFIFDLKCILRLYDKDVMIKVLLQDIQVFNAHMILFNTNQFPECMNMFKPLSLNLISSI